MDRDEKLPLERVPTKDEDFTGVCPKCGRFDEYFNVGREHWVLCHRHMLAWCAGANLPFFDSDDETPDDWRRNAEILKHYTEVTPGNGGCPDLPFLVGWAIQAVLGELWERTAKDYAGATGRQRGWHFFRHLYVLDRWLNGHPFDLAFPPGTVTLDDD